VAAGCFTESGSRAAAVQIIRLMLSQGSRGL
jgi:hypothetical protein